jgi:hypothetical protein
VVSRFGWCKSDGYRRTGIVLDATSRIAEGGRAMKNFYVKGKYRGVDVGLVVKSENQWEAAIDFVSNIIGLLCLDKVLSIENERKKIKIEKIDEVKNVDD